MFEFTAIILFEVWWFKNTLFKNTLFILIFIKSLKRKISCGADVGQIGCGTETNFVIKNNHIKCKKDGLRFSRLYYVYEI